MFPAPHGTPPISQRNGREWGLFFDMHFRGAFNKRGILGAFEHIESTDVCTPPLSAPMRSNEGCLTFIMQV